MVKWEYRQFKIYSKYYVAADVSYFTIETSPTTTTNGLETFVDCLNHLGEQGWELVESSGDGYTFKRPRD